MSDETKTAVETADFVEPAKPKGVTVKKSGDPAKAAYKADEYGGKGDTITLDFEAPGTQRKLTNLYTVKALDSHGVLVQLPVAAQINNNIAAPESIPALRIHEQKGWTVLFDFEHNRGVYCPMMDCYARWNDEFRGYCCKAHASTAPDDNPGRFGYGATTTANKWSEVG
jgi:hypothetical protein